MLILHWLQSLYWPETGKGYALGSSWAGANVGFLSIWYVTWKRHNCHERRCLRVSRHAVSKDGHQQLYCHKHLPAPEDAS